MLYLQWGESAHTEKSFLYKRKKNLNEKILGTFSSKYGFWGFDNLTHSK